MRLGAAIMVTMTASAADQSALRPSGPQAAHIHWLWDVMLWTTGVIYVVVLLVLFAGAWRRRKATDPTTMTDAKLEKYVVASVAASTVILFGLLIASVAVGKATSDLDARNGLTINVTGYQWWWRVEYRPSRPGSSTSLPRMRSMFRSAGQSTFVLTSSDVIHSFWAPNLHGKRDLIPIRRTRLSFAPTNPVCTGVSAPSSAACNTRKWHS